MDSKRAEALAAARLIVGFDGVEVSDDLRRLVERAGVAGVILFARNVEEPEQITRLTTELIGRSQDRAPLFISVDQEGGPVRRFRTGFTSIPAMGVLGAIDDVDLTRAVAAMTATELRAVGVNLNFAPVVDVNTNPDNPVIGIRSFGDTPERVSKHAVPYIEALQAEGVLACAKHFPGHGDTTTDSHHEMPVVDHPKERVEAVELAPFCQAAAAGVAAVMTAHVVFPAYDGDEPATLSPAVLGQLLREEVGFQGLCISDDLEMAAITQKMSVPEAARRSIAAGADLLLVCHTLELQLESIDAIARDLMDGELDEKEFMLGHQRIQNMNQRYLNEETYTKPDLAAMRRIVGHEEHVKLIEGVDRRARNIEGLAANTTGGGASSSGA